MKNKRRSGSLFALLARTYLLFTLTLLAIAAGVFCLWEAWLSDLYRPVDWDGLLTDPALESGDYGRAARSLAKGGGELRTAAAAAFRSATARRAALGAEMGRLRRPEHFNPGGWRPPSAAGTQKERHHSRRVFVFGARGGSRTRTPLRALAPEASESTNSTTRAYSALFQRKKDITTLFPPCQHFF